MYNQTENKFILDTLFRLRKMSLERIAWLTADDFYMPYVNPHKYPIEAIIDNEETDKEMFERFTTSTSIPMKSPVLHFTRCLQSGIAECTCMVKNYETTSEIL